MYWGLNPANCFMFPELAIQQLVLWQLFSSSVECYHFKHRRQCEEKHREVQSGINEGITVALYSSKEQRFNYSGDACKTRFSNHHHGLLWQLKFWHSVASDKIGLATLVLCSCCC